MAFYDFDPKTASKLMFARLMMTIGALVTALCGSCTLYWLVLAAGSYAEKPLDNAEITPTGIGVLALIVGGLPTALGVTLYLLGRRASARAIIAAARKTQVEGARL